MINVSIHSDAEVAFEDALDSIASNPELHPLCDDRHRFCPGQDLLTLIVARCIR
jgi:hypothetical protein